MATQEHGTDSRALTAALKCRWPQLRAAARAVVEEALRQAAGNVKATAETLGVNRNALSRMLQGEPGLAKLRVRLAQSGEAREERSAVKRGAANARWNRRGRPPRDTSGGRPWGDGFND